MTSPTTAVRDPRTAWLIGGITAAALLAQIALTRVLAAALAYHFGFLAISLALLGTAVGAVATDRWPQRVVGPDARLALVRWGSITGFAYLLLALVLVRLPFGTGTNFTGSLLVVLNGVALFGAFPAAGTGVVVTLALTRFPRDRTRYYAFDLLGAAVGAASAVPLLSVLSAPQVLVTAGVVAALASLVPSGGYRVESTTVPVGRSLAQGTAFVGAVIVGLGAAGVMDPVHLAPNHPTEAEQRGDRWTALNRVVPYAAIPPATLNVVFYDRTPAFVPPATGTTPLGWQQLQLGAQSVGLALTPRDGRLLIIGGGGGRDLHNARSEGIRDITVIELNRAIVAAVDEDLGDISGRPFAQPRTEVRYGDGRSVLAGTDERFDQIQLNFTDTLSPNSAQAFQLSENHLYTVEGVSEFLDHLTDDGILSISRQRRLAGDESLRATVLTLAALESRGVKNPTAHVVVLKGHDLFDAEFETTLVRPRPWTRAELDRLGTLAAERTDGIMMAPGQPAKGDWAPLARAPDTATFCTNFRANVCPPTDDQPFFFNTRRVGRLLDRSEGFIYGADPVLVLVTCLVLLSALAVAVLWIGRRPNGPDRSTRGTLAPFVGLGIGYLSLEIVLIERMVLLLGSPTASLSVVLAVMLGASGLGAASAARRRQSLTTASLLMMLLALVAAIGLGPLVASLLGFPAAVRIGAGALISAGVGFPAGRALPLALEALHRERPWAVGRAWAVNGAASVVAPVVATTVAVFAGFTMATLLAAAAYGLVAVTASRVGPTDLTPT